jgi:beta-glucosidase
LRTKFRLGLFENPFTQTDEFRPVTDDAALETAKKMALQSIVMLKNDHRTLPLSVEKLNSLAVIGPLADAPHQQLGTWVFDGDPAISVTGLEAIQSFVGQNVELRYLRAMETSRSKDTAPFEEAVELAGDSDAVVVFLGEEAILSGEAHSRADISLPGAQAELVERIRGTGKPVIAVILAGRPLTLTNIVDKVDAILYAWHPGTMGGPAIADILFGVESPSGKLPASFPRAVGQIPIYYNQKNTGKPPSPATTVHIDDIDARAPQTSLGMTAFHLDVAYTPLFAFGHGLSYADFTYANIRTGRPEILMGESLTVSVELSNKGEVSAEEVVQLYVRDLVGNVTRPVRELKGFTRVEVQPGQTVTVDFHLRSEDLAFYGRNHQKLVEAGDFHVWVGGSSETGLRSEFRIVANP